MVALSILLKGILLGRQLHRTVLLFATWIKREQFLRTRSIDSAQ